MWPFDKILLSRIKDLERQVEFTLGMNSILEREMLRETGRADRMEMQLFEYFGISRAGSLHRSELSREKEPIAPIRLQGQKSANWPAIRSNLENKAKEEYWKSRVVKTDTDKLEEEILGDSGDKDAGKIR